VEWVHPPRTYAILGYTANIPDQFLGFFFASSRPHGFGPYVDLKLTVPFRDQGNDFYDNISVNKAENIFGDRLIGKDDEWITVMLGATSRIRSDLTMYGAAGLAFYTAYRQYKDPYEILGHHGEYWIEDESKSETTLTGQLGFLLRTSPKWALQIDAQAQPTGVTLGIASVL
jgi:hypothetical protein